jgi:hypothetical protein
MTPAADRTSTSVGTESDLSVVATELKDLASDLVDASSHSARGGLAQDRGELVEALADELRELTGLVSSLLDRAHGLGEDWERLHPLLLEEFDAGLNSIRESFDHLHNAIVEPPEDETLDDFAERAVSIENALFWALRRRVAP